MERKHILHLITLLFLFVPVASCYPRTQTPLQRAEIGTGAGIKQTPQEKASDWETLISRARKEGRLVVLGASGNSEARAPFFRALKEKFGIELDMVTARAAELSVKIFNERKAGIFNIDVYLGGADSPINEFKPEGMMIPLESQLLLPEVLDPKAWWEGRLPFVDKDRQIFAIVANPSPNLAINTNLVSKEEVRSYLDLLNPKWKGKMILNDPSTPGVSSYWFGMASTKVMNLDFMRKLAQMDPTVTRDQRLQVEWLSQGKFPIAISPQQSMVSQFQKEGVSVQLLTPKEGTYVTSGPGNVAIFNKAPHPYAAKFFINWLLSKEGQTTFSQATYFQSARLDVPTSHLPSDSIRKPDVKYFSSIDEEFLKTLPEHMRIAREVFGPLMK